MARRDAENIISKLRQMSEEGLGSVMGELMANERMRKGLGRAGERLMANKHVFDRNVETVLDFVNIPSKRDIRELKSRLDTLSSQLVNLSIKIDRMLAADDTPAPRQVRAADPATPDVWDADNAGKVSAALGAPRSTEAREARTRWRDRRLMALTAHKREQPDFE